MDLVTTKSIDLDSPDDVALADRMKSGRDRIVAELKKAIVGQDDVVGQVLGDLCLLPWKGSPEAFLQILSTRDGKTAVLARDEYTGLLAAMKRGGYTAGLAQDFIRAHDGESLRRRVQPGRRER